MWFTEVSLETKANKEEIWALWADVENWNTWDSEIEYSKLEGNFQKDTFGILKPKDGPKTRFQVTGLEYLKGFSDSTKLPLCTLDFFHSITEKENGLVVTHRVEIRGALTFLFSRVIGKNIEKGLPIAVQKLISIAESKSKVHV
ncbi:MAG: polyketide cyclase/dehydrase and lipid transport [Leptospiraceae bacterium]|nr:polyketide cyclase/dehydrase and lipid transport [Leptospiraceae bacterium]